MPVGIFDLLGSQLLPLVAYIGPGADLALISSAIGLIATMGASLTFLVLWPFRVLWRRVSAQASPGQDDSATGS
jgi:hypothetical protein